MAPELIALETVWRGLMACATFLVKSTAPKKWAILASIRSCSCNCRFAKVVKAAKSLLKLWAWPWLMVKWWNMKELCFAPAAALPFKSHSWTHGIESRLYPWSQCVVTSVHLKIWRIIDRKWWDTSSTSGSLTSCSQSSWAALLTQSSKPSALAMNQDSNIKSIMYMKNTWNIFKIASFATWHPFEGSMRRAMHGRPALLSNTYLGTPCSEFPVVRGGSGRISTITCQQRRRRVDDVGGSKAQSKLTVEWIAWQTWKQTSERSKNYSRSDPRW